MVRAAPGATSSRAPKSDRCSACAFARALDRCWRELGEPDPFVVVEPGAGNGRLAREVLRARPACVRALHYVLVEISAALRDEQRERLELEPPDEALGPFAKAMHDEDAPLPVSGSGPVFVALEELPALELTCVVIANELLDNLPFGIAESSGAGWMEVRIAATAGGGFEELLVPAEPNDAAALDAVTEGVAVVGGRPAADSARYRRVVRKLRANGAPRFGDRDRLRRRRGGDPRARRRVGVVAHVPGAQSGRRRPRRARNPGHHSRRRARAAPARAPGAPGSHSPPTSRRPTGCAASASTSSPRPAGNAGRSGRRSATSKRSRPAAGSPKRPRSPIPRASAPIVS